MHDPTPTTAHLASEREVATPHSPHPSSDEGKGSGRGLSGRSLLGLAVTMAVVGGLMLLLLSRLIDAGHNAQRAQPYALVGHQAPDFTVQLWNGAPGQDTLRLADLKGKPVVLNFWASWCDSCRVEAPALQAAYQKYRAQGVMFVGLAFDDTPEHGKPFLQKYGTTYPAGPDVNGATAVAYGVVGVPETVFIGRDGKVVSKMQSWSGAGELEGGIQRILK
jgi:cytochrome c biogenesis protein CcmG, thiol:disulfide interchange protein DsbE